ncbi:hypothetical protein [Roseovarius sp.]|uniref:hypothetical protein n=1 Tax=Roseovarius sp. TaxID=1486281 RepID=UPI003B5C8638
MDGTNALTRSIWNDRQPKEAIMTRDELNRELRMHSATWQSVVLVYGILVGTLIFSASAIIS